MTFQLFKFLIHILNLYPIKFHMILPIWSLKQKCQKFEKIIKYEKSYTIFNRQFHFLYKYDLFHLQDRAIPLVWYIIARVLWWSHNVSDIIGLGAIKLHFGFFKVSWCITAKQTALFLNKKICMISGAIKVAWYR